jgi:hypothetical protein
MKTIEVVVKERLNYENLFSQKLDALKNQGNYRYFLEIERSAADFPVFRYTDAQGNRGIPLCKLRQKQRLTKRVQAVAALETSVARPLITVRSKKQRLLWSKKRLLWSLIQPI